MGRGFGGGAESRTPVYLVVGREDEYYGSEPSQRAYDTLHKLYREQGLSEEEIGRLLVLDIKERSYFTSKGMNNEHGGGNLFAADENTMGWLFGQRKETALNGPCKNRGRLPAVFTSKIISRFRSQGFPSVI